ncbi:MAG: aldo/keto reductase [Candidatus Actinomarina sp.]|jgi:2,5-diketo-D-gluconate reductase A|nr:aldo/keto reductase [Candidatus Actinomarina sp.]
MTIHETIPNIGLGTYMMSPDEAEMMTYEAIKVGYRHIDTAEVYRNEKGVAGGIKKAISDNIVKRSDLFITTKVFPGNERWGQKQKTYEDVLEALNKSLDRLELSYVDLYLIHSAHADQTRLEQWKALIDLKQQEYIKFAGVANWNINHLEEVKQNGLLLPDTNQIELHPWAQQPELVSYLRENSVHIIAYSSLVPLSTWRTKEGENSLKTSEMDAEGISVDSLFKTLANKYKVKESQLLLQWALQNKYAVLPKTIKISRLEENYNFSFSIEDDDMLLIEKENKGGGITWEWGDPLLVD